MSNIFIEQTEARYAVDGKNHWSIMYESKPSDLEKSVGITSAYKRLVQESFDNYEKAESEWFKLTSEDARYIVDGDFSENSRTTVDIGGNIITRVVKWDGSAKDLYVTYKNKRYFYCEFY